MSRSSLDLNTLEAALLSDPSVFDCSVRLRTDEGGAEKIIAYIVPGTGFSQDHTEARLRGIGEVELLPDAYVLLSRLPITIDGEVDERVLTEFAILDHNCVQRREAQLLEVPGIAQAAVVVEEHVLEQRPLHLSDLLSNGCSAARAQSPRGVIPAIRESVATQDVKMKKPAISDGGPLHHADSIPDTLPMALKRAAATLNGITYVQPDGSEVVQSYRELLEDAERMLNGLRKLGLRPYDPVILQLHRNQDFIPAFWACVLGGFLPAPISIAPAYSEANATVSKLHHCWELLQHPVILAGRDIAPEVRSVGNLLGLKDFRIQEIDELRGGAADHDWHESRPSDVCLLLFTSGSTGEPKGVQQSHRSLLARSAATAEMNRFDDRDITINWFPLDHVGGLVMFHLMDLFTCARQIQVPTELILQEPLRWLDLIEHFHATITWAPNFAFGLVNAREKEVAAGRWNLSSMRFILNGGEAIVPKTARRFLKLLQPHGLREDAMHPSWGMSETCSGVAFSESCRCDVVRDEDSFVEVGAPIAGICFRIVESTGQVLEEDQIGRLQVKGLPVTSGYYNNSALDREAFSSDGWFNTGDLAFLHEGKLTITGRIKDVIIVNGMNFYCHELEAIVETVEGVAVSFTAACPVRVSGRDTDQLAIFFNSAERSWPKLMPLMKNIREILLRKAGVPAEYVVPLCQEDIPKTAIGKIQRSRLRERFEAGDFADLLKEIDIQSANANTIPDWFYRKVWRRREPGIQNPHSIKETYLVFADRLGLAQLLRDELRRHDARVVWVGIGLGFQQVTEDHYELNPKSAGDYDRLVEALEKTEIRPDNIVHLWAYDHVATEPTSVGMLRESQYRGAYSLLWLVQALAKRHRSETTVRLFSVTAHAQLTSPDERQVSPERATISGLLATCSLEMPWLDCRRIDLETTSPTTNTQHVMKEIALPKQTAEVAYRNDKRLVSSLAKIEMLKEPVQPVPLVEGGLYLITGGLGGLGTELALYLVEKWRAKLVLVGRTPLPSRADRNRAHGASAKRLRNYERIEQAGGEFQYHAFDLTDATTIRSVIANAEAKWQQPLAGVFHLAGSISRSDTLEEHWDAAEGHWIAKEEIANFEWVFASKVYGTWAIFEALRDRPETLCVMFSSVNAFFGAASLSAYSAANSFLDCVSLDRCYRSHPRTYCLDWSMWNNLGLSESSPDYVRQIARNMGYLLLTNEQGISSMLATLSRHQPQVLIGIDGASASIRKHVDGNVHPVSRLAAYYVREEATGDFAEQRFTASESGSALCRFVPLSRMPLGPSGEIDREALTIVEGQNAHTVLGLSEPRNPMEQQVARIWREVLNLSHISIDQNFFELGGDSLTAIRLTHKLRETCHVSLPVRDLFENPTIRALATLIAEGTTQQEANKPISSAESRLGSASELLSSLDQLSDDEVDILLAGMSDSEFPR